MLKSYVSNKKTTGLNTMTLLNLNLCSRPNYMSSIHSWSFPFLLVPAVYLTTWTPTQGFPTQVVQALSHSSSLSDLSAVPPHLSLLWLWIPENSPFWQLCCLSMLMPSLDKHFCHLLSFSPPYCKPSCSGYFIALYPMESICLSRKFLPNLFCCFLILPIYFLYLLHQV